MLLFLALACSGAEPPVLSAEWQGTYTGAMVVNALKDPKKTVAVTLEVGPEEKGSAYRWVMTFKDGDKTRKKDYRLVPKAEGGFVLDEKNGIELPTTVAGKVMLSTFETAGLVLVARYELNGKTLKYEIQTYAKGAEANGVRGYTLKGLQTAEFTKP